LFQIAEIAEMKTANLYVSKKNLWSISDIQNECEKEIASMKSEEIGNANASFYDILSKCVSQHCMQGMKV
jgi:hypothetical protein